MTMYYSGSSSSIKTSSELEFTKHALGHILKRASPYAFRRRNDDDADRPLLDELNYTGYIQIKQLVHKTFPECDISQICQVYAPQIYGMYMLRLEEMKSTVGQSVQEKLLYRVTTESRAMKSLNSGLDWRRNKLDCGVSFSDDADYANFYDDNPLSEETSETRVIMICSVLVSETYVLPKNIKGKTLNVPPGRADTTVRDNSRVYIKYNDNDFYPLYFVYYWKRPEHMAKSKYSRAKTRQAMGHFDGLTLEEWCSDYLDYTIGYFDDDDDDDSLEERYSDYVHHGLLRRRRRRRLT